MLLGMTAPSPAASSSLVDHFWPTPSPVGVFAARRRRLGSALAKHGLARASLTSGWARPRNFEHSVYPFRAESHFLYLVGRQLEGAVLFADAERCVLFVTEPPAANALWNGPAPTPRELEADLELEVRSIDELGDFVAGGETATLPPQDQESAEWLGALLDRDVTACAGPDVEGDDCVLAEIMIELRLRHDEAALSQLRQAALVTAQAHRAGYGATRAGVREAVVRAAMEQRILAAGMTPAYGSIVTVHGEVLHDATHGRLLADGDLLLADVGAETPEGWAGDVTRTWPVSGRFSTTQRELYLAVLEAQRAAIAAVRPGVRYLDVHRAAGCSLGSSLSDLGILRGSAEDLYQRGAVALFFPHGVGHLLGLDVHDMEDLGDRAGYAPGRERATRGGEDALRLDRDLEPNMVVTIEPGFYRIPQLLADRARTEHLGDAVDWARLERFSDVRGIRIEDDVRVTESGAEVLTAAIAKTPDELEALIGR
jgi:Xaa-Pro aminopeptidase